MVIQWSLTPVITFMFLTSLTKRFQSFKETQVSYVTIPWTVSGNLYVSMAVFIGIKQTLMSVHNSTTKTNTTYVQGCDA
jgi:hypothetical protein